MLKVSSRIGAVVSLFFALSGMAGSADAAHAGGGSSVSKVCGGGTMTIKCDAHGSACKSTTLTFVGDGRTIHPAKPKGLDEYSAVGLACVASTDGTPYFYVQYGEYPRGCEFCEWIAIYDKHGASLTDNDPPILNDPHLPPAQQDYPNNDQADALSKKLGLNRPKFDFLN